MAKTDTVFIDIGTYPSEAAARADYGVVKDLHAAGVIGTYDAAVVTKDEAGKVHLNKDETATRHGAWGGAAVGYLAMGGAAFGVHHAGGNGTDAVGAAAFQYWAPLMQKVFWASWVIFIPAILVSTLSRVWAFRRTNRVSSPSIARRP